MNRRPTSKGEDHGAPPELKRICLGLGFTDVKPYGGWEAWQRNAGVGAGAARQVMALVRDGAVEA